MLTFGVGLCVCVDIRQEILGVPNNYDRVVTWISFLMISIYYLYVNMVRNQLFLAAVTSFLLAQI